MEIPDPKPPHAFGIPIVSIPPCLRISSSKTPLPSEFRKAVRGMHGYFLESPNSESNNACYLAKVEFGYVYGSNVQRQTIHQISAYVNLTKVSHIFLSYNDRWRKHDPSLQVKKALLSNIQGPTAN